MKGFNDNLIRKGDTVAVALSGGEDSVCLLHLLKEKSEKFGFKVVAVNVEHGIRGDNSVSDTLFCVRLCEELSIPLKRYSVDAVAYSSENGMTIEEGARKLRYDCFFDAVNSGFCNKIATAHHEEDDVETIFLNVLRGATISGLKGINEVSRKGLIIRPMLGVKKADIEKYIRDNKKEFVTDETNFDVKYTRNFIRQKVLPIIRERFPSVENSIKRLSCSAKKDDDFLYSLAKEKVKFSDGFAYIKTSEKYPLFSRAAILALKGMGVQKDFDNRHIDALFSLSKNIGGKRADLLGGLYAVKEGDFVVIKRKTAKTIEKEKPFKIGITKCLRGEVSIEKCALKEAISNAKNGESHYIDSDKLPDGAVIRKRKTGDVFKKFGGGEVSLKKFLTDKKIPADKKDETYLIAKDSVVYVILGVEISSLLKIDETTVSPLKITFINF